MNSRPGLTISPPGRHGTVTDRSDARREDLGVMTTTLFDIPLAQVTYDDVVRLANRALAEPAETTLTIDAINTMGLSQSCLDPRMREALLAYDLIVPDGMPVVWCMNAKGAELPDRVYGPYLADRLLTGLKCRTRVGLIGGYGSVHEWLRRAGRFRYPNAEFTLLYDAPPDTIDDTYVADCVERIRRSEVELLFVCLGVPRQYYWTALARARLRSAVCVSIGGAFDLVSGSRRIAPQWIQHAGLTWLYRVCQEPRRLGPRYLKYNSWFLWLLFRQELLGRRLPPRIGRTA
jgi:N-acetylglucosaminyldiphosphoundecaprenol N-acetyl-beta-D-mannosaminyltransferase